VNSDAKLLQIVNASVSRWQCWPVGTRPTDAQLIQAVEAADALGSVTISALELDRARASEAALLARVAALEAELAAMRDGLTGPPKKAGWYWCAWETPPGAHWIHICKCRHEAWWEHDQGWIDSDGDKIGTPTRYWPLPGEIYS
jgi:hypothetical protein